MIEFQLFTYCLFSTFLQIESGKEYQFRIETEIEYERDRKGDIIFILNCHADFAAVDTISTIYAAR